jgi:hypothetical protein
MFGFARQMDDGQSLPKGNIVLRARVLQGARFKRLPGIPDPLWELMEICWKQKPEERATFSGIVDMMKSSDGYVLDETHLPEYQEYRDRRLREAAPSVGADCHSELATLLG